MHGQATDQRHRFVAVGSNQTEVGTQVLTVVGVGTVVDDQPGALVRILAAQISDALFGNDDLHRMLAVIHVRDHRHDRRNLATLGRRRAGEDRQVGITCKVTRAADAVHHGGTHDVRRIHVAAEVDFDRRIHRHDTEPAHDFRMIGNLLRAQHDALLVVVDVGDDLLHGFRAERQRAGRGKAAAPVLKKGNHRILQHFGVHLEGRNVRALAKRGEHRVGDVADAGLERQELRRNPSGAHLGSKKISHVLANAVGHLGRFVKAAGLVGEVGEHHAGDLLRIDDAHRRTGTVGRRVDRDLAAHRRILRLEDIVHAEQRRRMARIELDDHLVGHAHVGIRSANRGRQHHAATRRQVTGLDHGPVNRPQVPIAYVLRHHRQVHIDKAHLPGVDLLAQRSVRLVGRTEGNRLGFGQRTVERRTGRRTGQHADLELPAGVMLTLGLACQRRRHGLGRTGRSKSAESDCLAVRDKLSCLLGGKNGKRKGHDCS